jgi:hypothetical protein
VSTFGEQEAQSVAGVQDGTVPFETLEAARAWVAGFVGWYNSEHNP